MVIPALDCEAEIGATVRRLVDDLGAAVGRDQLELVVVDDGSADATGSHATEAGADVVLRQPRNLGKGAAVRRGVLAATGRTVAFTDADLAYDPSLVLRLLEVVEGGVDVAIGSRTPGERAGRDRSVRGLGSRVVNTASRAVLRTRFRDTQCGLKAFRGEAAAAVFRACRVDRFAMDIEVLHIAESRGLRIAEVPVAPTATAHSTVRFGLDTARLFVDIARIRWRARRGAYAEAGPDAPAGPNRETA